MTDPSSPPPAWAGTHCPSGQKFPASPDAYAFFLSKDDAPNGCFSNAYREEGGGHRDATGATFWCINQELHYRKAVLFDDGEVAEKILAEREDAAKIKQLGRQVKGYDDARWCDVRYDVCCKALHAKFSQNEELKKILLDTGTEIIVEAARDKTWGIGCVEYSSPEEGIVGAKNRETGGWDARPGEWKGENLLGRCLMDVRKQLSDSQGD